MYILLRFLDVMSTFLAQILGFTSTILKYLRPQSLQKATFQRLVNILAYKGLKSESFDEFEPQITFSNGVGGIAEGDRNLYLHLHLKSGAFAFNDQLPATTRD